MFLNYKLAVFLNKLQDASCGPIRRENGEFRCRCPAHADNGPSLYVRATEDRILIHCGGGCDCQAVCERLDHDMADLVISADDPELEVDGNLTFIEVESNSPTTAAQPAPSVPGVASADDDLRNAIYRGLLTTLELSTQHFDNLRQRGLPPEKIAHCEYRTADAGRIRNAVDALLNAHGSAILLTVPGFLMKYDRVVFRAASGLLIPVRDPAGRIAGLKVRHDAGNGPKYTWASGQGASCGNLVHVPLGVSTPSETVRLTEGELKADVATCLSGLPTISAPGVANWALAVPTLKALGARKVLVAMDQDGKPGTLAAVEKAIYGLTREDFDLSVEWWPGTVAKGIDDLLATGGQPEVVPGLKALVRVRDLQVVPVAVAAEAPEPTPEAFPLDVFPPALASYCDEVAQATATPADFAAVTMLVAAGAAIGNSRALCLKENIWYEAPRFYAANVGDPASGKTPAMNEVLRHYEALQLRRIKEYKEAKAAYDAAKGEYDHVLKENRGLPHEDRLPLPTVPDEPSKPERFVTVDATVESLAPILEENPRGLLMHQDEGVGWVRGMGQYKGGRGNDRQFWLSNWSGKSHMVDRKEQGLVPISIPRPFVNVVCGIQPDMLNELADHQGRNDGFLHRILFVMPLAPSGTDWTDVTVTQASKTAWVDTLTGLRTLVMQELDDGVLGYRVVRFSPAAKDAWVAWWDAHAAEIRSPDLPAPLIGPWGKLKAYAARLALVLHYLWLVQGQGDEGDVDVVSVERAIRLINYFKSHLTLVYGRLRQTAEDNHLYEVLDWIRQQGGQCTARDLTRAKKVMPSIKAKKMLVELEERGYGQIEWREAANNKKVQWFVFNPT